MHAQTRRDLFVCAFVRSLEPSARLTLLGESAATVADGDIPTGSKNGAPAVQAARQGSSGCTVCPLAAFGHDLSSFRAHYQTDWHQFNLQARQRGKPTVTREEHEELGQFGAAILESESDDELDRPLLPEKDEHGSPFAEFSVQDAATGSGQPFLIYKRILLAPSKVVGDAERQICTMNVRERLVEIANSIVVILLIRSGRIAAAVYEHDTAGGAGRIVQSKIFKRYTTRRGQGGSQLSKDATTGGRIRSAGASLRRSNEAHLQEVCTEEDSQSRGP